jgi:hypothetical protein
MSRLATLEDMAQAYSDLYKEINGIRPRWETYSTIEEYGDAITNLLEQEKAQRVAQEEHDAFCLMLDEEEARYMNSMGLY